jgi:hypothetical protein
MGDSCKQAAMFVPPFFDYRIARIAATIAEETAQRNIAAKGSPSPKKRMPKGGIFSIAAYILVSISSFLSSDRT